jgi:hypothetical protein
LIRLQTFRSETPAASRDRGFPHLYANPTSRCGRLCREQN